MKMREPDLTADLTTYATEADGKTKPISSGYSCPCMLSKNGQSQGWDARLIFDGPPIFPGQHRRVGFAFLTPEGFEAISSARHFYLWDGGIVGEATVSD